MIEETSLTADQLRALVKHLQDLTNAVIDGNNALITRLHASPTFGDEDRKTLNRWSEAMNDIHEASDAHMATIVGAAPLAPPVSAPAKPH